MLGLFQIDKTISLMAVCLQLPESWTVYPVFHIKLLEPFWLQQGAPRPNLQEILAEIEGLLQPLYEVKEVIDSQ
jgi:hypothetical protein